MVSMLKDTPVFFSPFSHKNMMESKENMQLPARFYRFHQGEQYLFC